MPIFITRCSTCGKDFEPSPVAIRAGGWQVCPTCSPQPADNTDETSCHSCGRPLRTAGRTLCLGCLG